MEPAVDPDDLWAIINGVWEANRKLDEILDLLRDDDEEEEAA
jgi:hypothetical protein